MKAVCADSNRLMAMGQDPLEAVSGARLHHQLLPDVVRAERWSVTNTRGPSFNVDNAEVEVRCIASPCASLQSTF